jgi:hypothetical protein
LSLPAALLPTSVARLAFAGSPVRLCACFQTLISDFLSLGVLGVLDDVGMLWMVLAVALHGGISSNVSKKTNFYIRHPIGYLTGREVYFPAPSNLVVIIEWFRYYYTYNYIYNYIYYYREHFRVTKQGG